MHEQDIFEGFTTMKSNEEDTPYNYLLKKSMTNKNQPVIVTPTNQHYIASAPIYCQHHHCHDQLIYSSQFMNQAELIVPLSPVSNNVYPSTTITSSSYQSLTPASLPDTSFMDFSSSYLSPNINQNQIMESLTSTCTNNDYDYNHTAQFSFYPTPPPSISSFTQHSHIATASISSSPQQQPSIQVIPSTSSLSNVNPNSIVMNNTPSSITSSPSLSSTSSPALSTLSTSSLSSSSSSSLLNTKDKKKLDKEKSESSPSSCKKKKKNQQESTTTPSSSTKIYACEFCDKVFYRAYNLKSHRLSHSKIRPYVCRYDGCPWRFSRPHDLRRHEHLHAGHRPYGCTSCGKRFSRLDALERHARGDAVCQKVASMLAHAALISNNNQLSLPKTKSSVSSSSPSSSIAFVNNDQNGKEDNHSDDSLSSYSLSTHLFSVSPSFSHF